MEREKSAPPLESMQEWCRSPWVRRCRTRFCYADRSPSPAASPRNMRWGAPAMEEGVLPEPQLDKSAQSRYLLCRYNPGVRLMNARVQRWGNSLAVRIPKALAIEAHLEQDSLAELSLVDGKILVSPIRAPKVTLEQLLAQVTEENLHSEVDTGPATGNEAW
jgi:antitoxin MazE